MPVFDEDFDEDDLPIPVVSDTMPTAGDLLPIAERIAIGIESGKHFNGGIVPFPAHLRGRAILDALKGDERKSVQRFQSAGYRPTVYEYIDGEGRVFFALVRYDHDKHRKEVRPLRYCGKDSQGLDLFWFTWPRGSKPLMGLEQLATRPDAPVLVVEGEKTAVAAALLFPDYVVVTWASGSGSAIHADVSELRGRNVIAWPDNDDKGRPAARIILAKSLGAGASAAAMVDVPREFEKGWDLADPVPPAAAAHDLRHLLGSARPMSSADAAAILRGGERKAAKRRLLGHKPGYSNVTLDAAIDALNLLDPDMGGGFWHRVARSWYHAFDALGLDAFNAWSAQSDKYKAGEPAQLWEKYGNEEAFAAAPLAWLMRMARRAAEGKKSNANVDTEAMLVAEIDALNANHAVIHRGGKLAVMREEYDPRFERYVATYLKKADFVDTHVRKVALPSESGKGEKFAALGKYWFGTVRRRAYDGVIFLPGRDAGPRHLNLWRGFTVDPVDDPESWSKFKHHILQNIAGGDEKSFAYIINWMAYAVQHLDKPVRTTLVLTGAKGAGKSIFSVTLGYLFGDHHFATAHAGDVIGKFNARLENVLTLALEEAVAPESRAQDSVFKDLINSNTLRLEEKFMGVWTVPNHLRIILTSNNDHVVRADGIERRFAVFSVTHPDIADPDARRRYFGELVEQMESGGYEAMLGELLARDVSAWNPEAIPETEALRQQKLLNLSNDPVKSWLHERLADGVFITRGGWEASSTPVHRWGEGAPTQVPVRDVLDDFVEYAARNSMRVKESKLSRDLPRYMPTGFKSRVVREATVDGVGGTRRVFDFPTLDIARDAFSKATGLSDWPDAEVEQ